MSLGRVLMGAGLLLLAVGALFWLGERFSWPVGRLPGDIVWRGKNGTFYFPWMTCLVLSVLLSLVLWLLRRR